MIGETESPLASCHQMKLPGLGLVAERSYEDFQTTNTVSKLFVSLHTLTAKLHRWRQQLYKLIENGNIELVPMKSPLLLSSILGAGRYFKCYQKKTVNVKPVTIVSCLLDSLVQWWLKACGSNNQPISDWTQGLLCEMNPIHNTVRVPWPFGWSLIWGSVD